MAKAKDIKNKLGRKILTVAEKAKTGIISMDHLIDLGFGWTPQEIIQGVDEAWNKVRTNRTPIRFDSKCDEILKIVNSNIPLDQKTDAIKLVFTKHINKLDPQAKSILNAKYIPKIQDTVKKANTQAKAVARSPGIKKVISTPFWPIVYPSPQLDPFIRLPGSSIIRPLFQPTVYPSVSPEPFTKLPGSPILRTTSTLFQPTVYPSVASTPYTRLPDAPIMRTTSSMAPGAWKGIPFSHIEPITRVKPSLQSGAAIYPQPETWKGIPFKSPAPTAAVSASVEPKVAIYPQPEASTPSSQPKKIDKVKAINTLEDNGFDKFAKRTKTFNKDVKSIYKKVPKLVKLGLGIAAGALALKYANENIFSRFNDHKKYLPNEYADSYDLIKEQFTDFGSPVHMEKLFKVLMPRPSSTRNCLVTNVNSIVKRNDALFLHRNAIGHTRYN